MQCLQRSIRKRGILINLITTVLVFLYINFLLEIHLLAMLLQTKILFQVTFWLILDVEEGITKEAL